MHKENLWPDGLFEEQLVAPAAILKEQANHLSIASRRDIIGRVVSGRNPSNFGRGYSDEEETASVTHSFRLEVPALNGYTFDLFEVSHQPRSLYPVFVRFSIGENWPDQSEVANEKDFRTLIRTIFSSQETIGVIRTLKAQVVDPDTLPPAIEKSNTVPDDGAPDDDDIPF